MTGEQEERDNMLGSDQQHAKSALERRVVGSESDGRQQRVYAGEDPKA